MSSHQADRTAPKSRKRSLDELKATDPPEDEQHSSQSAFQQCYPHTQQNSAQQQPQAAPLPAHSQALQLLLSAAQSCEGMSRLSQPPEEVPLTENQNVSRHAFKPVQESTDRPTVYVRSNDVMVVRASTPRSAQLPPQQPPKQVFSHVDVLYAPTRSTSRISAQLVWDTQRLETPALDADSVQAALEFADAVRINPAQHAQQPSASPQHRPEQVTLLHTLEVGIGRLDVLRILAHRLRSSSLDELSQSSSGVGQLLDVMQDLLKDMEASQALLCHAEQTVLAYQQAASARVESLQVHTKAAQDHWLQTQRLQDVAAERRAVLQRMMM